MNFDADTHHPNLKLSSNNTSVQHVSKELKHPPHPYRFDVLEQVLSKQKLLGRCFFQVEVQYKKSFIVGVCQGVGNMKSSCGGEEQLGDGPWSFGFGFDNGQCIFLNNADPRNLRCPDPPTGSPATMRVGIFLDHRAGVLVFYRILTDDTLVYICEIQNFFWEPLLAGVFLPEINSTAKFL
ncbi:unnamed protein product [Knipowitschia caucasica]|uniref:B30.2/SPRY domain-containing protein n=1 Tax=Knipowitschia caucasica TaxID=637954 RepID=A0AAV2JPC8_KNICA